MGEVINHQILKLKEVLRRTGIGRVSLYNKVSLGEFPRPIRLGQRSVGWVEQEVSDWINQCIVARDAGRTSE